MNSVRKFLSAIVLLISLIFLTAFNAEANLLTAGDFEGSLTLGTLNAPVFGQWNVEGTNAVMGATLGVSPSGGTQMLAIYKTGGGNSQNQQYVSGSFVTGTTVDFEVELNASGAGTEAVIFFNALDGLGGSVISSFGTPLFFVDNDTNSWETLSVSGVLAGDASVLEVQVFFNNAPLTGRVGFADNAVLTATAPVPEPATMLLMGTGLVGLAGFRRKKFKK